MSIHDTSAQKAEINSTVQTMHDMALKVGILLVLLYAYIVRDNTHELLILGGMLAASLAFIPAQGDHRVFRLAYWIRQAENDEHVHPWEEHKAHLRSRTIVMPIVDIGMATAPLYALFNIMNLLYGADFTAFVWVSVAVGFGLLMIPIGQRLARW